MLAILLFSKFHPLGVMMNILVCVMNEARLRDMTVTG